MQRFFRKIIRITAEDSPNVKLARAQIAASLDPTGELVVPGVLPWDEYQKRLATWDAVRQAIGLQAIFYEGAEVLLFPPFWLDLAEAFDDFLTLNRVPRKAKGIGVDPAEGGDKTAMCAVDEYGVIELTARKTPNTAVIRREAKAFILKHNCPLEGVIFDRGGGGQQHADYLREDGFRGIRTVGFGDSLRPDLKRGLRRLEELMGQQEEKYVYRNRRSELYGVLSTLLDPDGTSPLDEQQGPLARTMRAVSSLGVSPNPAHRQGLSPDTRHEIRGREGHRMGRFAIPRRYKELREQMAPIPKTYDREGRLELLPKRKKDPRDTRKTLTEIIGHSPDELDAVALAVYGMTHKERRVKIGAVV